MSIKPVDFQLSVPRAAEVSKARGDEQHKELLNQQNQVGETKHQSENSMKQVQKRTQAEEARIREKQEKEKREGKKQRSDKDNKNGNQQSSQNNVEPHRITRIDVKI